MATEQTAPALGLPKGGDIGGAADVRGIDSPGFRAAPDSLTPPHNQNTPPAQSPSNVFKPGPLPPGANDDTDPSKLKVSEALKRKSVIDSDLPAVGGWGPTNKLFGKTPGERMFNLLDWYGIGYVVNSAISIWAGDQARQGKFWPAFKKVNHGLGNSFLFRDRKGSHPHKFLPLETEHLDLFVDTVREHAVAAGSEDIRQAINQKLSSINPGKEPPFAGNNTDSLYGSIRRTHLNHMFDAIDERHHTPIIKRMLDQHIDEGGRLARFTKDEVAHLRSLTGKPEFTAEASRMFKTLANDSQALKTSRTNARVWTSFFMLSAGGWLLMFPIKWLEDYKAPIVKYWDNRYEKKHHLTEIQKDALHARHDELDKEPPQTYASVLIARLLSYPFVIGSYMLLGPRIKTMEHDGHESSSWLAKAPGFKNYKGTDTLVGNLASRANKRLEHWEPYKNFDNSMYAKAKSRQEFFTESKQYRPDQALVGRFSAKKGRAEDIIADTLTETVYSLWMVTCTFVASRFTAAFFGKKQEPKKQPEMVSYDSVNTPASGLTPANANPAPAANVNTPPENDASIPKTRVSGGDALSVWMAKTPGSERLSSPKAAEPARA